MIILIITNIILVVVIGFAGITLLIETAKDSRPIVVKEAKALREYYESKLKDLQEKTKKAEEKYTEYMGLYNRELQRNSDRNDLLSKKVELEAEAKCLNNELSLCEDRINEMAQENAYLKERIEKLKEPVKKGKGRNAKNQRNNS